ncbi:MAG: hypothetical protein AB7F40_05745 [Victivallaceae bacterium]|nr:hypothetical protein [Victivallaceae bacterium]
MRNLLIICLVTAICSGIFCKQKAEAFVDPVTIAILAPIAIKGAQIAAPYVMRGLVSGGKGLLTMGEDVLNIMRLPLGVVQSTVLAPFCFSDGLSNIVKGGVAPFKLGLDAVLLPVRFCGVSI